MAVTIQQIAEKAGVSRGTVDRALNNRGRINPEVAEMVKRTAEEMGYVHKARKRQKNAGGKKKIGIVTQLSGSSFMLCHAGNKQRNPDRKKRAGRTWCGSHCKRECFRARGRPAACN